MIKNRKRQKLSFSLAIFLAITLLAGCSSEGIDRHEGTGLPTAVLSDAAVQTPGQVPGAESLGPVINPGPSRFVQLEKLNFEAALPSVISLLFKTTDRYGNAVAGLGTSDFRLLEDGEPVSPTETSLSIVPHEELPFDLKTVIMIDVSSSILPSDLTQIKSAVRSLLIDDNGNSALLPQQQIALYTFNDTVVKLKDFSTNIPSIVSTIDQIQPAIAITPTNLYGAIIEGTDQWSDSFDLSQITQGNLIVITDGADTAARHTYQEALASTQLKSVYTLGVGDQISSDVLESLGTSGYYPLTNFEELGNTLQNINNQVKDTANSFYYLHYASPKRRAEGPPTASDHRIELSLVQNANTGATSIIQDTFNSAEFSNVTAEVFITGQSSLEIQQTATYKANTRWGPAPTNNYIWTVADENESCVVDAQSNSTVQVTGVAEGSCTLSAEDLSAGGAKAWLYIDIIGD
jgi:hypothetical protein